MDKIYTKQNNLVIEIPLQVRRCNPYDEKEQSLMSNIIGVIDGNDYGFAHCIDMSYSGKADQISSIFYHFYGSEEQFEKLCSEVKIDCYKYSKCVKCGKVIYGVCTWDNGEVCSECDNK
ncbi:MAG: hypothetical protein WCT11_00490 [Candidatus Magasanikbacteria bacterium]